MALVNYSDSESEKESPPTQATAPSVTSPSSTSSPSSSRKRAHQHDACPPPLPSDFHDLYTSASRVSTTDDPALHGGRKRIRPHVEGTWPTHVYLEWYPTNIESNLLSCLLSPILKTRGSGTLSTPNVHSLLTSDLGTRLPLHISLSRPITLLAAQREPFQALLTSSINKSGIRPLDVFATSMKWVSNEENTRWFLVLSVSRPAGDALNRLLALSNTAVEALGETPLYAKTSANRDRRKDVIRGEGLQQTVRRKSSASAVVVDLTSNFHISIAWCLEAPSPAAEACLLSQEVISLLEEIQNCSVRFESVKVKIGNVVHDLKLSSKLNDDGEGVIRGTAG